ncbi:DUF6090 family protein [Robiginitalea sp. IMCC44478]|uniref:DUF6090 family protein n=1 Tax=Robiginitalea sp. IMCC44478 TaxID=3459122 RepID=UPI0040410DEF
MIKFFRKIRQNLLSEGKNGKYFKYAIGEIVLVVFGILIALQINNWNEYQNERETEMMVLNEVSENLDANILRLQSMIERCNTDNHSADIVVSLLNKKIIYSDSLNSHFPLALNPADQESFISYVGYESLKNLGFNIIQNNGLKNEIINLFEGSYLDLKAKYNRADDLDPEIIKFRHQHFLVRSKPEGGRWFIPIDLDNLLENKQFESHLVELKGLRGWIMLTLNQCLKETQRVHQMINDELKKN